MGVKLKLIVIGTVNMVFLTVVDTKNCASLLVTSRKLLSKPGEIVHIAKSRSDHPLLCDVQQ